MKFKDVWKEIELANSISLFRHVNPDADALGSQYGLAEIIKEHFPTKTVTCYGEVMGELYEELFDFNYPKKSKSIGNDLAIILDTGNAGRIDGDDWKKAKKSIKIDHHLGEDNYATINVVNSDWIATSEAICEMVDELNLKINKDAANYLFSGIVADSGRFQYENTSANTLRYAASLLDAGANKMKIYELLYTMPLKLYRLQNHIRSMMVVDDNVGYCILEKGIEDRYDVPYVDCKNMVYALNGIVETTIWLLASFDKEINKWRISIRSRKNSVNTIAEKFGGGGHRLAAAVRVDNLADVHDIIRELINANKDNK